MNPTPQKFTKTDLAKFEHSWEQLPHLVCLGAEKNFREFMLRRSERQSAAIDAGYFHRLVAKAILFRAAERVVTEQQYGGYRANIVAYTISKLSFATAHRIDLDSIWRNQRLSSAALKALTTISRVAYEIITDPPDRVRHIGEWSKKLDCWKRLEEAPWAIPAPLERELVKVGVHKDASIKTVNLDTGLATPTEDELLIIAQISAIESAVWFRLAKWAKETKNLQPWQRSLAFGLGRLAAQGSPPSIKQANQGMKLQEEAYRLGFS
jgi:hypothetical protein